jgi:hypothetical protein
MSDHRPPRPSSGDRMRDTLTHLRVDVDAVRLDEPSSVRRRGQARTRHQAVTSLAAVVAVVAVAVSGGALFGGDAKDPNVIATHPPTTAPPENLLRPSEKPFLRPADVGTIGVYTSFRRNADVDESQRPLRCLPSPTTLGATETFATLFYSDLDATFTEHVLRFDDVASATDAVSRLSSEFASCDKGDPDEATVNDRGPGQTGGVEGVSQTLRASRLTTPTADAGISYFELGVVRSANVVVVLQWSSMGQPDADKAAWVWTADRLQQAIDRAVQP